MRISDWSSDVCSSDLTAWPVGLKVLEEVDEVALLALPDLVWQAPLPISAVPAPPSFRCEDYFTRGAPPVPPEPEPDPLSPEPRRPLPLDEQHGLRREMVAKASRASATSLGNARCGERAGRTWYTL